jgi:putative DNA primase/helicase
MQDPTRNEVAHYRTATARAALLQEVWDLLEALPTGDLATAQRALDYVRGPVCGRDLRYAAGRFYVLGHDGLWTMDDERDALVAQLLQAWCDAECNTIATYERELRAAHGANALDGDDDGAFTDRYDMIRRRFDRQAHKWTARVQSGFVRERVLADLRAMAGVHLSSPEVFDADADALAVANGLVNLRTGELRPLRAADLVTQRVDVPYDLAAEAPLWDTFLRSTLVTDEGAPDEELIAWIRRLVGYGITGHAREQVFAVFHGSGANGKSVLIETLSDLFEAISRTAAMNTFEVKAGGGASGDLARLAGVRLVFASEGEVGARVSASTVKRITGEDRITARFLYRPEFEFRPRFLLIMASNTKAPVIDSSEGYWRRLRVVPFLRYLQPHERDARLRLKLRDEFPGILRWAIEGAREWYSAGLGTTAVIEAQVDGYRQEMDPLAEWMTDRVEVTRDYADVVRATDVWKSYVEWAGDAKVSDKDMMRRQTMHAAFGERKGVTPANVHKQKAFRGVRLLDLAERTRRDHMAEKEARALKAV